MGKFPVGYCVPTNLLTKPTYDLMITKLVTDGYTVLRGMDKSAVFNMWNLLGVNQNEEIMLYDYPHSYLKINEWLESGYVKGYNVWNEAQLNKYLGDTV